MDSGLISAYANAAVKVADGVAGLIADYRTSRLVNRARLEYLERQLSACAAIRSAKNLGSIVQANIEEIAAAWREIKQLTDSDTPAVVMNMHIAQLESLHGVLRENLRGYEGRV